MNLSRSSCPEVFYIKDALENLAKFTGKLLCWSLFFNKIVSLHSAALFKKRLRPRCFPTNFAKFYGNRFKELFWTTTSGHSTIS